MADTKNGKTTDVHLSHMDRELWDDVRKRCDELGLPQYQFVTAALRVYCHYQDTGVIEPPKK